jgi:hypothetical protein
MAELGNLTTSLNQDIERLNLKSFPQSPACLFSGIGLAFVCEIDKTCIKR